MINQDGFRLITPEPADVRAPSPIPVPSPNPQLLTAQGTRPRCVCILWILLYTYRSASTTSYENHGSVKDERLTWEVTSLDDLKPLGFIGRGACGLVKKVLHVPSKKILAVKVSVS